MYTKKSRLSSHARVRRPLILKDDADPDDLVALADEMVEMVAERSTPILVIAGTYRQAEQWAKDNRISRRRDWVFVNAVERMYGVRGVAVVFTGTWWSRQDSLELYEEARRILASEGKRCETSWR